MDRTEDRSSQLLDVPAGGTLELTPEEISAKESENALRQADRMFEMVEHAIAAGKFRLRPSSLIELNRLAVDGLVERPGAFRVGRITISNSSHVPPLPEDVAAHVDDMCDYVCECWESSYAVHLAAYLLWRLNWIHPFDDGNGRTSRAISYLVLCVRTGHLLPGTTMIPELIASSKRPYYEALEAADAAWRRGVLDLSAMEKYLTGLLAQQLLEIVRTATGPETASPEASDIKRTPAAGTAENEEGSVPIAPNGGPAASSRKPRLFIGSSTEGLSAAEELQLSLEYNAEVTIWSQGVFGLSGGSLETLSQKAAEFDFAAFMLTPDDVLTKREVGKTSARDNVLLELGLFIGSLGRFRTFIVCPRGQDMHMPTDLAGVTVATYDANRSDGNLHAALGPVATQIKRAIRDQGRR